MSRVRLFEWEDLGWFPSSIRNAGTDLLRFKWEVGKLYLPFVPRLREALVKTASHDIIDLGSGGAGPMVLIYEELIRTGYDVRVTLTDKYPNLAAFRHARERTNGGVEYVEHSVDAMAVPADLRGFRTMFLTLHHFRPEEVRLVLLDAVQQRCPIGAFDFTAKTPPPVLMALMSSPPGVLLTMPLVRPFRWSRLFWTYIVPIVPFYVTWDALVSGLRLYAVEELQGIVATLPPNDYVWEIGQDPTARFITYLIGYPAG